MTHQQNKTRGFTLIETLVAIAVLMIAVAGPLTIANRALTSAMYSRDQSIASYLAQEEMEIVKNVRDNTIKNGGTISSFLTLSSCVGSGSYCDIDIRLSSLVGALSGSNPSCDIGSTCQLYISPSSGYSHDISGDVTKFTRYFYLTPILKGGGGADPNDYQITVKVSWNEGTTPNDVILNSELVNANRQLI